MEAERTAQELAAHPGAGEMTAESPGSESYKHTSTMQDIFSEVQSLVERSNIINVSNSCFTASRAELVATVAVLQCKLC